MPSRGHWNFQPTHLFFVSLGLIATVIAFADRPTAAALWYSRRSIMEGELWRLLTSHLVHLSPEHLLLNLAGLALVWIAFLDRYSLRGWSIVALTTAIGSSLGMLWLNPEMRHVVGMSALLHGLFAAGAYAEARTGHWVGYIMLGIIIVKLIWEQTMGPMPGIEDALNGGIALDAHLYGAVSGLVTGSVVSRAYAAKHH